MKNLYCHLLFVSLLVLLTRDRETLISLNKNIIMECFQMVTLVKFVSFMSLGLAIIGSYSIYYIKVMTSVPEFRVRASTKWRSFISESCPIIKESFYPSFWAGSSTLQTVVPSVLRSRISEMNFSREYLNCPDGGEVSIDWFEDSSPNEQSDQKPISLMFPGLIGDSQSEYLRSIIPIVHNLGYRVAAFNNRGRGGMKLKTPKLYCATNFDDYELAIDHIRRNNPESKIVASGFSMGGMVLCRYLAERGAQAKVDAAMLVSANYDLVNGTKHMETGWWHRSIARVMTKALIEVILSEKEMLSKANKGVDWDKLPQATSFRELDRLFTCPMWGYKDPEEYFIDATNNERVKNIRVPTLCLNSADDMFSPYETLPLEKVETNKALAFIVTSRGGHLGFMDGVWPTTPYYGDRLIEQYYRGLLGVKSSFNELLRDDISSSE